MTEQAIRSAEQASREIKRLFDRLGNTEHPRGDLYAAYRSARRQIANNALDLAIVLGVLGALRRDVQAISASVLLAAVAVGTEQASRDTDIYGLPLILATVLTSSERAAVGAAFEAQAAQVVALTALGDKTLIVGDDERVGVLSPVPITLQMSRWITTVAVGSYMAHMLRSIEASPSARREEFGKEAVAVLDRRTTQTCQNVAGQVVGLDEPFQISGSPSYGSEQMWSPFHDRCRTTVAVVRR